MPSQLLTNDKISFVAARSFSSRGKDYQVGDDFPQEDARDIEVFVRARYVIPVVDDIEDKVHIRHWHRHIRPKDEVVERLGRDRTQLMMPTPPDSMDLETLTHQELTPEPEADVGTESESASEEEYDPGEHTVKEVEDYLAEHPEEAEQVLAAERKGRARKGLLEE